MELEVAAESWRDWFSRGEFAAGAAAMRAALDAPGAEKPSVARVRVLYADGLFAFRQGDQERSRSRNEEALALARKLADVRGECEALTGLARVALREGDYSRVVELASEARMRAQQARDRASEAPPLHLQAAGTRLSGDYDEARRLYHESLALNTELGNAVWQAMEHHNLGWVELHRGDVEAAAEMFAARDRAGEADAYGNAWQDLNQAALAFARGDRGHAEALFAVGREKLAALGAAFDPDDQFEYDWLSQQLRSS